MTVSRRICTLAPGEPVPDYPPSASERVRTEALLASLGAV